MMLEQRMQIPLDSALRAAAAVCDFFFKHVTVPDGAVVAGYAPIRGELDDMPILRTLTRRGKICALPHMASEEAPLAFRFWNEITPMTTGKYGITEPAPDRRLSPDIVLVPLAAFDINRHRLGYGAGCYDRTLAALAKTKPVLSIGLGYETQLCDEIPAEETDIRMDMIITDGKVYQ